MNYCKEPDCRNGVHGHGYCSTHYYQHRELGDLWPLLENECVVIGCSLKTSTQSGQLCSSHYGRRKGYRLTEDQFLALVGAFDGRCWICRWEGNVIDHDHKCKRHYRGGCPLCVRGWLCSGCNLNLIGKVMDSVELLEAHRLATSRPLLSIDTEAFNRAKLYLQAGSGEGRFDRLNEMGFFTV